MEAEAAVNTKRNLNNLMLPFVRVRLLLVRHGQRICHRSLVKPVAVRNMTAPKPVPALSFT